MNTWKTSKEFVDVILSLVSSDAEVLCQTERTHAVHQTEVNHFGNTAVIRCDLVPFLSEYFRRCRTVNVLIVLKGLNQALIG